jgi:sterol desaturase/sphingolipid hydroxylase (fatty acid hydroxylase superfamily)
MDQWVLDAAVWELALVVLAALLGVTVVSVAIGFALERAMKRYRIWAVPLDPGQYRLELKGNVIFLLVQTAAFTAVLGSGLPRCAEHTTAGDVGWFFGLMLGFQVYYYGLHRAMHTKALVGIHRWHHKSRVTTPLSGQSVSFGEALGWAVGYALLPALVSHVVPISAEGWAAYIAFNIFGNMVGHSNFEMVPKTPGLYYSALFSNAFVFHSLHHARWTGHYSFQSALMDRVFGTEWKDWPALHQEVAAGQPLKSLRETR